LINLAAVSDFKGNQPVIQIARSEHQLISETYLQGPSE
jgi:hypothetical protein